jgi:translocation protein SEC62
MPGPGAIPIQPGQRPTPEQIQQVQRKIAEDAQKAGMTVPQFIEHIKKQAQEKAMAARMAQQQGGQPGGPHQHPQQGPPGPAGQRQAIRPGPPTAEALAVAKFLSGQDLKTRTCILNGERKEMFKGT